MPFAAPVMAPINVSVTLAGLPAVPPEAVKSTASPLVLVTLPAPVIANVPLPAAMPSIVPVKPRALSSCSVSLPPEKVTFSAPEPASSSVPPLSMIREPAPLNPPDRLSVPPITSIVPELFTAPVMPLVPDKLSIVPVLFTTRLLFWAVMNAPDDRSIVPALLIVLVSDTPVVDWKPNPFQPPICQMPPASLLNVPLPTLTVPLIVPALLMVMSPPFSNIAVANSVAAAINPELSIVDVPVIFSLTLIAELFVKLVSVPVLLIVDEPAVPVLF